ncbi:Apoptosis-enhancing nuclease [Wickerhamomyces ciferrii]|uniref:Apoptosis-enhancing nuclease n=1 Tax=Wickerhamomyces ciferrii (strain ATCC 14091 / BCRC 22168 / CBS 111 / JCM 3599 / NBRC 0793 / NRRL Y-1031 F-60-10) TaxID=1206466 RepID=K0KEN2_WICCF|nr:Apoptosis-enhancing nuclease [Wickerhamomyces ciferrii]CCH40682.1 Apoptosis-enhancing nuclease [Wickerhamomyces ciferrii]
MWINQMVLKYDELKARKIPIHRSTPGFRTQTPEARQFIASQPAYTTEINEWVETIPPANPRQHRKGIYSIDCETVWTTTGTQVGSITIIDWRNYEVLNVKVRPSSRVLNYNGMVSGLDGKQLFQAPGLWTQGQVQAFIVDKIKTTDIIVGMQLKMI